MRDEQLTLPYEHLNLKFNPFGAISPQKQGELAVLAIDLWSLIARLKQPDFAALFVGESGRGKSTHLCALWNHFPEAPFVYIPPARPVPEIPIAPLVFVDELQRVPRRQRAALFRRRASFVIGSHQDHSREMQAAGLAVVRFRLNGVSRRLLRAVIQKRIEWARRRPDRPVPCVCDATLHRLAARFRGDLWAMGDHLYDLFQDLEEAREL